MIGVAANVVAVLLGGGLGLLLKKGIPVRVREAVMTAIGLCTLYIGLAGALEGGDALTALLSLVPGVIVGTLLNLDGHLERLGKSLEKALGAGDGALAQGFVTASLLFCVGAMTVVGSLQAGLSGDNRLLYTKSALDFLSAMMLASAMGPGVLLAAGTVLVLQGGLVLLAGLLAPVLTDAAVTAITCVGSLLIVGLGLNLLRITKLKVADFLPALLFAPVVCWLVTALTERWLPNLG